MRKIVFVVSIDKDMIIIIIIIIIIKHTLKKTQKQTKSEDSGKGFKNIY